VIVLVIGGQYGDEGKGSVVQWLAEKFDFDLVVRVGGANAGHTCALNGEPFEMQQLCCSWVSSDAPIFIPATALLDEGIFLNEVERVRSRGYAGGIWVHPEATLIDEKDKGWRENTKRIGSMGSGIAPTRAKRCLREAQKVKDVRGNLEVFRTFDEAYKILADPQKKILVEGTQGFGLSLDFSNRYPHVTSTNITPYQILADMGVPFNLHRVISVAVFRTYPVRVPSPPQGNSGAMFQELTCETVQARHPKAQVEYDFRPPVFDVPTPKRIGEWDGELARQAIWHIRPDFIVLTHFDWEFTVENEFPVRWEFPDFESLRLPYNIHQSLASKEESMKQPVSLVGMGIGNLRYVSNFDRMTLERCINEEEEFD